MSHKSGSPVRKSCFSDNKTFLRQKIIKILLTFTQIWKNVIMKATFFSENSYNFFHCIIQMLSFEIVLSQFPTQLSTFKALHSKAQCLIHVLYMSCRLTNRFTDMCVDYETQAVNHMECDSRAVFYKWIFIEHIVWLLLCI